MRPISLKLDDDQIAALDTEAEERDLTRSQYLRRIIDARHEIELHSEDQTAAISRVEERIDTVGQDSIYNSWIFVFDSDEASE